MKNIFVNPLKVNYEEREKTVDILKKVGQYSQYCPTESDFNQTIFCITKISTKV